MTSKQVETIVVARVAEEFVATRDRAARAMQEEGQDEQSGDCSSDSRGLYIYWTRSVRTLGLVN